MKKLSLIVLFIPFSVAAHYDHSEMKKECKNKVEKIVSITESLDEGSKEKDRLIQNFKEAQIYIDRNKYCKAFEQLIK